jgi:streptogramin lyase
MAASAGFHHPLGAVADAQGNLYVAYANNDAAEEMAAGNGPVTSLGSGPNCVTVDPQGRVYVLDSNAIYELPP